MMGQLHLHQRRPQTLCILFYFGGTPEDFEPKRGLDKMEVGENRGYGWRGEASMEPTV